MHCQAPPHLDFGQNLNGLAIVRGAKHGVHQFLYGHGQAETVRKIAVVSVYPANALSSALSKLAKVELITRFDASRAARGEMLSSADVLEILSLPLLGIIPEDKEVLRASNLGTPVVLSNPAGAPARAYKDAARRLSGQQIDMVTPSERRGLLNKLFGRRAA